MFTANGYTSTQHLMGNVEVQVSGNSATMTSYLHATHVVSNGTIDVANGTYEDEVVKSQGEWRIKRRTLKLSTFSSFKPSGRPRCGSWPEPRVPG